MATAKLNKKIPKTARAGKVKANLDKAARAASAKAAASKTATTRNGAARNDGKKGGITKTETKLYPRQKPRTMFPTMKH